jgi:hypothetical protein
MVSMVMLVCHVKLCDMFDLISFMIIVLCIVFMACMTLYTILWYSYRVLIPKAYRKLASFLKS